MDEDKVISSAGGLIAPAYVHLRSSFTVTYRVKPFWRRWWLRWHGWSTEWTCEYDHKPLWEALPSFQILRGGVSFEERS